MATQNPGDLEDPLTAPYFSPEFLLMSSAYLEASPLVGFAAGLLAENWAYETNSGISPGLGFFLGFAAGAIGTLVIGYLAEKYSGSEKLSNSPLYFSPDNL
ncbi:MAG: hypothetical protein JW727_05100 [Candidatus Aenigmarchaeota archaeon]|nr:hypothetical protein [Candidatus Aenigmarchaeota archaeon]